MRLYQVNYEVLNTRFDKDSIKTMWLGSQKEVADFKREIKKDSNMVLMGYDVVDVPTNKKGLLEWLNKNFNRE